MANSKSKKLTFNDIIARKILVDEKKNAKLNIYVESLEGELEFKKPTEEIVLNLIDKLEAKQTCGDLTSIDALREFDKLIYLCCPTLQNNELKKEFEIIEDVNIVKELLTVDERTNIGKQIIKFSGCSMEEAVKN